MNVVTSCLICVALTLAFSSQVAWGNERYHAEGCNAPTEYTIETSFPWNKRPSVLPKFHLTVTHVAFIVHNERFKLYKYGRKASRGLAYFAETGDVEILRAELGGDGFIVEGAESIIRDRTPSFIANVTIEFSRRLVSSVGRVEKTPDWIVASATQDLCNLDPYLFEQADLYQEWKLGDYKDISLLDTGIFITPTERNARPRPIRGVLYDKDVGYSVTREVIEAAAVGVIHVTQKACPVFGASAYSVGDEWQQGPCTRCKCVDTNRDECVREVCPPPACEYFTFEADRCCPVCQDRKEYLEMVERARNPDPPVIVKKPRNMTAIVGDTLTMDCTGWGDPKPQITLVRNQPEEYVHFHLEPETSSKPGLSWASHKIDFVTAEDAGRYTCFVYSMGGTREEHAYVNVVEK